ncbi:fimbrial biogenesis chaperone [Providencia heimbachae]|uniref:Putative fimbrial chaperone protein n=1 Tax=Providencia heimbachae ATCC 35613 TaxID=1354272 RepID=A0A1B7K2N7_9GAMM|nr:molecular chaperone [Providencia heimbachae]OAT54398.1 putative fimbrial chaperone protein [Providencia heimbachae ATCC 35613]QCJ70250.1 molecular chaperone [Providencia heimbachae]SQH13448.1 Chaperone protein focC precursor [Providencia heimbachae]
MKRIFISSFFLLLFFSNLSHASGISVGGTRFVYEENKREIDIPIFNGDKEKPFLIQSWVSPFEGEGKAPFIATPPLFRIEPDSNGSARISFIGEPMGSNQEKLYLLNIKSIPPKDDSIENELQIIINSQFKLFLRSKDIESFDFEKVQLVKNENGIMINNQTPYHLSIKDILIDGKSVKGIGLIYPHKNDYILKRNTNNDNSIVVQFINDYGAIIEKKTK